MDRKITAAKRHPELEIAYHSNPLEKTGNDRVFSRGTKFGLIDYFGHEEKNIPFANLAATIITKKLSLPIHKAFHQASLELPVKAEELGKKINRTTLTPFATGIGFDYANGKLTSASAGHLPALFIYRNEKGELKHEFYENHSAISTREPLGISEKEYEQPKGSLPTNGIWIAYSDGITETKTSLGRKGNGEGQKQLAETALKILRKHPKTQNNMKLFLEKLRRELRKQKSKQTDDETLIAFKPKGFRL
ncbi:SpoIIE family protein phosphatase [Candidatus Micrarchaeota archaeon]|nr:SpoIIE family protein phosphatase [Candidatus Micrarchaeota archaeon]